MRGALFSAVSARRLGLPFAAVFGLGLGLLLAAAAEPSAARAYNTSLALKYAHEFWLHPNHNCHDAYQTCTPWSCWGEYCGYPSHGGDCANFVSQCLVTAGHPYLNQGYPCRGYPCGKEEIGANNLDNCLHKVHGWRRTCGHLLEPPADIEVGDVLVYHAGECGGFDAHATIVTEKKSDKDVRISCHSPSLQHQPYGQVAPDKPFYSWLKYMG